MANKSENSKFSFNHFIGPLLDDVAPYSGLGMHELKILSPYLRANWSGKLYPLPSAIGNCAHWQYGTGTHSSDSRKMLGSVMIRAKLNNRTEIKIHFIVIEGSSQWLIGNNVTTKCDIIHTYSNYLKFSNHTSIPLENIDMHSYVFLNQANNNCSAFDAKLLCATGIIKESTNIRPWSELKKIIDKVHKHVCGHASLSDIKILLKRSSL